MHNPDFDHSLDRARAASELQQLLLDTEDLREFLDEVVRYAADTLTPVMACGITVERDGNPLTVASSDALARNLDEVQYDHRTGPCLTALHTGQTVIITDLATDDRWGNYGIDALAHGLVSSLSLALDGGPDARGALNFYAGQPKVFNAELQHQAQALAIEACRALRLAARLTNQVQLTRNLETAMASRSVIDQALGIIMGQNRCTTADAFDILRRASNHRNIKLRDVAHQIVTRISGQHPTPTEKTNPRPGLTTREISGRSGHATADSKGQCIT